MVALVTPSLDVEFSVVGQNSEGGVHYTAKFIHGKFSNRRKLFRWLGQVSPGIQIVDHSMVSESGEE